MEQPWAYESLKEGNVYVKGKNAFSWNTCKLAMIMSIDYSSGMSPSYKVYCISTTGETKITTWKRDDFTYMDKLSEAG